MSKGKALLEKCRHHRRVNLMAARLIVKEPVRYAGLPLMWAEMYLRKHAEAQ